ncbi:3-phosphoshikimate 1-carboxyvinyltransferase [Aequorivita lipolytica]|uniref:3-phosphoshikimate 1-carboxyvinyltransferase n=1 Tax=Aequorivita lipolytica TaxID=153267 RepID=A0A5C6YUA3_9FLAO|nr:3-phosphoshikimate 1-carboxyvinyltransferase [Aequorivita lipolytica]TXD70859.1 3-phosphoshikimate 1-carboxyvinyltransferase [Aequorivita lipolytica]SRX49911.1 3-phosphoshikimate 1-carboxyvinyltransferase [Aequorivita lipolytica]
MKANLKHGKFPLESVKINICGSKSESNRLLILQAQFPNITIDNLSESDDTAVLQKGLKVNNGIVDVHHAGTAMRFLTAYYSAKPNAEITLTGSQRMQERPIRILVDALKTLGADIQYLKNEGFPPLKIKGKKLQKNEVSIKADVSSQYISALMLVAPILPNGLKISLKGKTTSVPYIEMTLSLLKNIEVVGDFTNNEIVIPLAEQIKNTAVTVESDWSSASYFYSLVALSEDCKITLGSFLEESFQGDSALVQIYDSLGVRTVFSTSEKSISLSKKNIELPDSLMLDLSNTPDLAQTIAVTCFGLGLGCRLTGLHTLKIKETDRLSALKNELEKLGATIQIDENSLSLEMASEIISNKTIETYQDHRMAMAFAPLAVKTELTILDAEVVSKSYPNFWKDIQKVGVACVLDDSSN